MAFPNAFFHDSLTIVPAFSDESGIPVFESGIPASIGKQYLEAFRVTAL
jgi:hypothetical protein